MQNVQDRSIDSQKVKNKEKQGNHKHDIDLSSLDWNKFETYELFCNCEKVDLGKFNDDYEEASAFYFQMLRKLKIKVFAAKIELENQK